MIRAKINVTLFRQLSCLSLDLLLLKMQQTNVANVRLNEVRHVCYVDPAEISTCCLIIPPMTLAVIIHVHRGKNENHFHMTWR